MKCYSCKAEVDVLVERNFLFFFVRRICQNCARKEIYREET